MYMISSIFCGWVEFAEFCIFICLWTNVAKVFSKNETLEYVNLVCPHQFDDLLRITWSLVSVCRFSCSCSIGLVQYKAFNDFGDTAAKVDGDYIRQCCRISYFTCCVLFITIFGLSDWNNRFRALLRFIVHFDQLLRRDWQKICRTTLRLFGWTFGEIWLGMKERFPSPISYDLLTFSSDLLTSYRIIGIG